MGNEAGLIRPMPQTVLRQKEPGRYFCWEFQFCFSPYFFHQSDSTKVLVQVRLKLRFLCLCKREIAMLRLEKKQEKRKRNNLISNWLCEERVF